MNPADISFYVNAIALAAAALAWIVFAWPFLVRKKTSSSPKVRASMSWIGLALQGLSFLIILAVPRTPLASPLVEGQYALNTALQVLGIALAAGSAWLAVSAVTELGKQWSLQARLIEGHKLITSGAYGIVRHPIYTAMLGMLLATGLALSHWLAISVALVVFYTGTKIRTTLEERLLRDAFGEEFEAWRSRVPGLIP